MKYKGITIPDREAVRILRFCLIHNVTPSDIMNDYKTESIKLQRLANKITNVPKTVKPYT